MAKAPVKRRYNTDTNQWEVVKPRTGPTPASNTRKKMRLAAAAKAAAPKPAAKPKAKAKAPAKKPAPGGARPEGPAGSMPVDTTKAKPSGPTARGGKRGMSSMLAKQVKTREQQSAMIENAVATNAARPRGPQGRGGKRDTGLYLAPHPGASTYNPKKKKLKSSLGVAIGGYSLK